MQTSAKTKEFMKQNHQLDISEHGIEKLLLEHERDTRYTAIDIIRSQEQQSIEQGDIEYNNIKFMDGVETENTIHKIHNMKVGE